MERVGVRQWIGEAFAREHLVTDDLRLWAQREQRNPHYEPTADHFREIHEGDLVLLDMWAKKDTRARCITTSPGPACWASLRLNIRVFRLTRDARKAGVAKAVEGIAGGAGGLGGGRGDARGH